MVSVSLAEEFSEVVAMDLKIFESSIILHLVDHVTRSATAVVKSKDRNEIIKHLFRTWISIFGASSKIFIDNGGEFSNEDSLNFLVIIMAGNIVIKIIMRCVIPATLQ